VNGLIFGATGQRHLVRDHSDVSPAIIGYIADVTSIQNSFKYLSLATLLAGVSTALLLSSRVHAPVETTRTESG
jgi:hypothetical protein